MQPNSNTFTNNAMMRALLRIYTHYDTVPSAISLENTRFYIISNIGYTLGWMIHTAWFFTFLALGQYTMMLIQLVSIATHVAAINFNRRGYLQTAMCIGMLEVVAHQVVAARLMGWGAGFQYIVMAITLFPFLMMGGSTILKGILGASCVCSFMYLDIFVKKLPPTYELSHQAVQWFNYTNIVMCFCFMATWAVYLNIGVKRSEALLVKKKQQLYEAEQAAQQAEVQRQLEVAERDNEIYRLRNVELKNSHDEIVLRNRQIEAEKKKSEELLLNILPEETAAELMREGRARTRRYEMATVLFTDFASFTNVAEQLNAEELVTRIDEYFRAFDEITLRHGLEKIKTIGDAYMCAGGIPIPNNTNPFNALDAAIEMMEFVNAADSHLFKARIGLHTGTLVAGVVGKHKFQYDIWGDTVNIAARMEQHSEPGRINISGGMYELVKDHYKCEYRGKIAAKNKGDLDMYFVNGKK